MSERPEGTKRTRSRRAPAAPRGNGTTTLAAAACRRDPRSLRPPTMCLDSARRLRFLRRRELREPEEHDLALQHDAVLLVHAAARLDHEGHAVRARRAVGVLDEVRVLRRDLRAADPVPLETAELEHPPRPELARWVLEDAPEGPLVRGLRVLATRDELGDCRLDLRRRAWLELELDRSDDLTRSQLRVSIGEPQRARRPPLVALGRDDARPDEDLVPVPPVRARVHEDAAARRARNRARELEAAEARCPGAVQAHGVRRATAGPQQAVADLDRRKLALEPDDEDVKRSVGREHVRPETDDEHVEPLGSGVAKSISKLLDGPRTRQRRRRASGSDGRQLRERNVVLERVHAGRPSTSARAMRHGSPTPSVRTTSPGRTHARASSAASSRVGAQPRRTPRGTSSRTVLPLMPLIGASRSPITSVTIAASARPRAAPSSRCS